MKSEELKSFIGKKVKVTCIFGRELIFYHGILKSANDSSINLIDKYSKDVLISLDSIKKVEEI
jgi:ribosome maturation factor RimP